MGPAPSATDPLLGKWKVNPPTTPTTDPDTVAQRKAMANAILVFSSRQHRKHPGFRSPHFKALGTLSCPHIPATKPERAPISFQRAGTKLILGQAPDNKKTDTYVPDPIL